MARNIFQQQIVPEKPKVLSQERIFVYMPKASDSHKGLASFNQRDFSSPDGHASLRWPMEMLVQDLADPLVRPSFIKVLDDEFVKTNQMVTVTNPVTGVVYQTDKAELRLKREGRNALLRPDLVMLNSDQFEIIDTTVGSNTYKQSRIRVRNPQSNHTLVKVNATDFTVAEPDNTVGIAWPLAHVPPSTTKTGGYGLVKVAPGLQSNLKYNPSNELQVDLEAVKTNLAQHLATRPSYAETDLTKWPERNDFIDPDTGLAKRNSDGNTLLAFNKQAIGLSEVENRKFNTRTYDEFGADMKSHFTAEFNKKLDRSFWDGPTGLFRDWAPPTDDRNTVQRWFMRLEEEDNSLWSSIRSMNLYLGIFPDDTYLKMSHEAGARLFGASAQVITTNSYWAIQPVNSGRYQYIYRDHLGLESITGMTIGDRAVNLNNEQEFVWDGVEWIADGIHRDEWEWYDTTEAVPNFNAFVETDAAALQPNAPVANVSVGISGKWIQSDHVHPSDPGKLDAWLIEDATIDVTSLAPTGNDFHLDFAKVTILNSSNVPIIATIVTTPQYLSSIADPDLNDLAIARNNGNIFEYDGIAWQNTSEVGTITYDTNSVMNIPYVRTAQYLHNWKDSPTVFNQDGASNETYWAGTLAEFELLDLADVPANTLFIVEDDPYLEPSDFITFAQIDRAGLTLSTEYDVSTDRFVTIDRSEALYGVPLTLTALPAVPGVRGERRVVEALDFGTAYSSPPVGHRMAITVDSDNGRTLAQRYFAANEMVISDNDGNLDTIAIDPADLVLIDSALTASHLVKATSATEIETWDTGDVVDKLIVTDGLGGVEVKSLTANSLVRTNVNGGIGVSPIIESNILKTSTSTPTDLATNKILLSDTDNTVKVWASGGAENAMVVRGADAGTIKLRTHTATNRILITGANGTVSEVAAGEIGQVLASGGTNAPGWVDAPTMAAHLPQTRFTANPTELVANALSGLAAVVLNAPIAEELLRNNCIYYW